MSRFQIFFLDSVGRRELVEDQVTNTGVQKIIQVHLLENMEINEELVIRRVEPRPGMDG